MGTARVLIVDDEPAILRLTSRILTKCGYEVTCASNARQAMEELAAAVPKNPVHLVISDVVMPDIQGPVLLEFVREISPPTALMLMTGFAPSEFIPSDVPVLQKPFLPEELLAAVERSLADAAQARHDLLSACNRGRELCLESAAIGRQVEQAVQDARETVRRLKEQCRQQRGTTQRSADGEPGS